MVRTKKVTGSALLTALFIMTLVAIVATAMSIRLQLDIYRTRLIVTHDKLYLASQAVTFWALNELNNENNKFNKLVSKGMVAQYPENRSNIIPGINLKGGLYDLQAQININSVTDTKNLATLINLFNLSISQITRSEANNLALALKDWISDYSPGKGKDVYTSYYLSQTPPYYPSHQLTQSKSELRLLKDVTDKIYRALEPLITSLPETTAINLNTASKKVLISLGNGLNETQVNEVLQARMNNKLESTKDLTELLEKINVPVEQITLESTYFLNVAYASMDEFNLVVYSLLKRTMEKEHKNDKEGKPTVTLIRQSFNVF